MVHTDRKCWYKLNYNNHGEDTKNIIGCFKQHQFFKSNLCKINWYKRFLLSKINLLLLYDPLIVSLSNPESLPWTSCMFLLGRVSRDCTVSVVMCRSATWSRLGSKKQNFRLVCHNALHTALGFLQMKNDKVAPNTWIYIWYSMK